MKFLFSLYFLLGFVCWSTAQTKATKRPQVSIQFQQPGERKMTMMKSTYLWQDSVSVMIQQRKMTNDGIMSIPKAQITEVYLFEKRKKTGALVGLVLGGIAGLALSSQIYDACGNNDCTKNQVHQLIITSMGMYAGGFIGFQKGISGRRKIELKDLP